MRILLAEDEDQLSRAVAAVLRHMNYEVDIAQNGQIAVRLASQNTYDCMVLDIMMPGMDGIDALKKIRAGGEDPVPGETAGLLHSQGTVSGQCEA